MSGHHHCDHDHSHAFEGADPAYKRVLKISAALNLLMFIVEILGGRIAGSVALQADALDFLADFLTYTISLLVIGKAVQVRARAALLKGISLAVMGLYVFGATVYRVFVLGVPEAMTMGVIAIMALAVNLLSVLMLYRWRNGDANVRSVWLCSRNDAIGNVAVMGAAVLVAFTQTGWPDVIVAAVMALLFLSSSFQIVRQALRENRAH